MNNIKAIGFLDTLSLTANLRLRYWEQLEGGRIDLRTAGADHPILETWASARSILVRIKNESAPFFQDVPGDIMDAYIERLEPDTGNAWDKSDGELLRIQVTLAPSPAAVVYCGAEAAILPVGQVTYINDREMTSTINRGPCAQISLVVRVRQPNG